MDIEKRRKELTAEPMDLQRFDSQKTAYYPPNKRNEKIPCTRLGITRENLQKRKDRIEEVINDEFHYYHLIQSQVIEMTLEALGRCIDSNYHAPVEKELLGDDMKDIIEFSRGKITEGNMGEILDTARFELNFNI